MYSSIDTQVDRGQISTTFQIAWLATHTHVLTWQSLLSRKSMRPSLSRLSLRSRNSCSTYQSIFSLEKRVSGIITYTPQHSMESTYGDIECMQVYWDHRCVYVPSTNLLVGLVVPSALVFPQAPSSLGNLLFQVFHLDHLVPVVLEYN